MMLQVFCNPQTSIFNLNILVNKQKVEAINLYPTGTLSAVQKPSLKVFVLYDMPQTLCTRLHTRYNHLILQSRVNAVIMAKTI